MAHIALLTVGPDDSFADELLTALGDFGNSVIVLNLPDPTDFPEREMRPAFEGLDALVVVSRASDPANTAQLKAVFFARRFARILRLVVTPNRESALPAVLTHVNHVIYSQGRTVDEVATRVQSSISSILGITDDLGSVERETSLPALDDKYDGWEVTGRELGSGGQGTVYLARSPERVERLRNLGAYLHGDIQRLDRIDASGFARRIIELAGPDSPEHLGALKVFKIGPARDQEAKSLGRLDAEIKALSTLRHPALLRLLHHNVDKRFMVTEYHACGTLDRHLGHYKGQALKALEAFRPLVDAVAAIHERGAIHRDIKTQNVFVTDSGGLTLGDFGIVIFRDASERLTTTFEKVGTSFWMPPWAYKHERLQIEDVKPSLDVFPLAKVLWSMLSGRNGFAFWEYNRDENNLETLCPADPIMSRINGLLSRCIVREETQCTLSARDMLAEVDRLIQLAQHGGQRPADGGPWACRMCGVGRYDTKTSLSVPLFVGNTGDRQQFRVYVCSNCGHGELFRY